MTVFGGPQWQKGENHEKRIRCFNTDDGIGRATMRQNPRRAWPRPVVSIPMTVFGGLQYRISDFFDVQRIKFQYR